MNIKVKIGTKIALVLSGIAIFFIISLIFIQLLLNKQINVIVSSYKEQQQSNTSAVIKLQSEKIYQTIFDYTYWDDAVNYVKKPNKIWADENIGTILKSFDFNATWVFNMDTKQIYYADNVNNNAIKCIVFQEELFDSLKKNHFIHFFLKTEIGLIEIEGATIHTTNDIARKTPPKGYLFLAKVWDRELLDKLKEITGCAITIPKTSDSLISGNGFARIQTSQDLQFWNNTLCCKIYFNKEYSILPVIKKLNTILIFLIVIMAVVTVFTFFILFRRWIAKPLRLVTESLEASNRESIKSLIKHKSEFSQIGILISEFLKQKLILEDEISERKLAVAQLESRELQLSASLDAAEQGLWDWNIVNNAVYFDKKWKELHGLPGDKYISPKFESWENIIYNEDIPNFNEIFLKQNTSQNQSFNIEYRVNKLSGETVWIYCKGRVIKRDENGKPMQMLGTVQDITDRKMIENELREAKTHAEESDRLKSAFLANMSHEIRTPMNGILGFAEILKDDTIPVSERQEYLSIIENSGRHLLNLINDIVDVSKIEAGLMNVVISEESVNELLDKLFLFFNNKTLKNKNIEFILTKPENINEIILKTDKTRFNQIFSNLISNAIKFTNAGSIEFGYQILNDNSLLFFVKDSGEGIPIEKQKLIFERFMQAETNGTRASEGTGLGLAISKAFVELLGGKIWVESEEGRGSIFYFSHPYQGKFIEYKQNVAKITDTGFIINLNGKTILVAEDVESNFLLLNVMLKQTECGVLWAKNGEEVVEMVKNIPEIDLVLMDLRMPVMDGYEATRIIKQLRPSLPVIAQTAYSLDSDKNKSFEAGCSEHITKPIIKSEMFTKIDYILKHK